MPTRPTQGPLSACFRAAHWPAHNLRRNFCHIRAHTEPAMGQLGHSFEPARAPAWCLTIYRAVACPDPPQRSLFARSEIAQSPLKHTMRSTIIYQCSPRLDPGPASCTLSAHRAYSWPAFCLLQGRSVARLQPAQGPLEDQSPHRTHIGHNRSLLCACPGPAWCLTNGCAEACSENPGHSLFSRSEIAQSPFKNTICKTLSVLTKT